jgi:hypothetical protein
MSLVAVRGLRVTGEDGIIVRTWALFNDVDKSNFMVMSPETNRQSYGQNTA